MAGHVYSNYEGLSLTGTQTLGYLGNGITASSVHQIYCLSAGSIEITPMLGNTFTWNATTNIALDVIPSSVTVMSGTFIGFRTRPYNYQGPFAVQTY